MKRTGLIAIIALLLMASYAEAQRTKQKKWKVGLSRLSLSMLYEYETRKRADSSATTFTETVSQSSSGALQTTDLTVEYIFGGQFGLEFRTGLTGGVRNFTLEDDETKIGDVKEEASSSFLFGANFYINDHSRPGLKFYIGLLTGNITVKHSYSGGGERDDGEEDTLVGYKTSQSSEHAVPTQILKIGTDWILESVGIRLEVISLQGQISTTDGLGKTDLDQNQKETITLTSGFSIGVFSVF